MIIDIYTLMWYLTQPNIMGAYLAIIRNIGGYAYNCFEAKKVLPYSGSQFLYTLTLWETLFTVLGTVGNLPTTLVVPLAIILDFLRSLKATLSNSTVIATPTDTTQSQIPAPPTSSNIPPPPSVPSTVTFSGIKTPKSVIVDGVPYTPTPTGSVMKTGMWMSNVWNGNTQIAISFPDYLVHNVEVCYDSTSRKGLLLASGSDITI